MGLFFLLSVSIIRKLYFIPVLFFFSFPSSGFLFAQTDTALTDTTNLPYPIKDTHSGSSENYYNPFDLKDPSNVEKNIEYDPDSKQYIITEKIGNDFYKNSDFISFEDYLKYYAEKSEKEYWQKRTKASSMVERKGLIPKLEVESQVFDRIFGGSTVDIRPQGSAELIFAGDFHRIDNPALSDRLKRTGGFKFDENIQMNLIGQVGEKLRITTNYNTKANFDFENQMRLEYSGYEDEIIQKIEAGNVGLPLKGTLITGSPSLFGIKTQLKFGRLTVTNVLSQQKSETQTLQVEAGAQITDFEITADDYEANKHYFLTQYFRDNYNNALKDLPFINSNFEISKIEVWVTNTRFETEATTRDIIAFMDLGEPLPYASSFLTGSTSDKPDNNSNNLMEILNSNPSIKNTYEANSILGGLNPGNFISGQDFVKLENARKLQEKEFKLHPKLGYISLNFSLNSDEVLAVAFEYTANTSNNKTFKVGEFSQDVPPNPEEPNVLFVKLLKSPVTRTDLPLWDLMMKNIYSIGAYNLQKDNFKLDVIYEDDITGADMPFIPAGKIDGIPLIQLLNLDKLNTQNDPSQDGVFDFVEDVTINSSNGRVIFPIIEPFGSDLRKIFLDNGIKDDKANNYVFDALYDSTKYTAQQQAELNKFKMVGTYQSSSSSEISLGAMNIPKGSVSVLAGGQKLEEGRDYNIDYLLGRVTITNDQILSSGKPIQIKFDNNLYFSVRQKSLLASRFDYQINENFNIGGTVLKLSERPLTEKIRSGEEPVSNMIWGADGSYQTESRFLTNLIDKIPLIDTKEPSSINIQGEIAQLRPGHSRFIELDKEPTAYIDDFEASESPIDLKTPYSWVIASAPKMFTESDYSNDLRYGFNRAKFSWYYVDQLFYRNNSSTPKHIRDDETQLCNHYIREVLETEIWPDKEPAQGQIIALPIMNMAFYPKNKGLYNFDVNGLNDDGTLRNPDTRWGGIMRDIITNDFEAANVEFIEFWLMDPFIYDSTSSGGELYFNLGNISEDILKDSRKIFENGLPKSATDLNKVDSTTWGRFPTFQSITNSFDNDPGSRKFQDVGLDGLSDQNEQTFFKEYLDSVQNKFGSESKAFTTAQSDPSSDNYHYYRGNDFDDAEVSILNRYKLYNGLENNSPTAEQSKDEQGVDYPTSATNRPDGEDLNKDNTLSELESYFQYLVELTPSKMKVGENYITDVINAQYKCNTNANAQTVKWYQFKIPLRRPDDVVGNIQDFKSIRFMRMFMTGFRDSVVLRFAKLQLLRSEWRKYESALITPGEYISDDNFSETSFDVSTVDIEENGSRTPVNYVLPPGFERQKDYLDPTQRQLNEQSLSMSLCNLRDGEARAVYKNLRLDMRTYKSIKMFVHAEGEDLRNGDITLFMRLGTDFTSNYYEYEIPLSITSPGKYSNDSDPEREIVWPETNNLELPLEVLRNVKLARDQAMKNNSNITAAQRYEIVDGSNKIYVVGIPDLSKVKTIMIGVRNPKADATTPQDDGFDKCGDVWINELRLTDFDETGGWAAKGLITTKLADFGTVTLAGSRTTFGFGGVEQSITERSKDDIKQYDASSTFQMGKFFPDNTGIRLPMYLSYSELVSTPQFDPFNEDIPFTEKLNSLENQEDRRDLKYRSQDRSVRKSINFTNVSKDRKGDKKARIYDIENFALSYAYNEIDRSSPTIQADTLRNHKAGVSYNFNKNPKNHKPLNKLIKSKNKYLRPFKEFNFYTMPKNIAVRADLDRRFGVRQLRNTSGYNIEMDEFFDKSIKMNRAYNFKQDLTRSLKFDFSANANAIIDEPSGRINTQEKKDTLWSNFQDMGRPLGYNHTANLSYDLPIDKFPLTDWISVNTRYNASYSWLAGSEKLVDQYGHMIQNSNSKTANAQLNFTKLYNKSKYLRDLSQPPKQKSKSELSKDKVEPKKAQTDSTKTEKDEKEKINYLKEIGDNFARILTSIKNANASLSFNEGTVLPGYKKDLKPDLIGQDWNRTAPGMDFLFGYQPTKQWLEEKAEVDKWFVEDTTLNLPLNQNKSFNYTMKSSLEPLRDLKIDLNASYNESFNHKEFFRNINPPGEDLDFKSLSNTDNGTYSISYITWKTAFNNDKKDSMLFQKFEQDRPVFSRRLGILNSRSSGLDSTGYYDGYGRYSQAVLIPAFLATYTGENPDQAGLTAFPKIPKPNWRVTYNGLSKLNLVKKYLTSVNLTHAYRSNYNVNKFVTLLSYTDSSRNLEGNFLPQYEIEQVSISEQFAPLISIDMTWKNSLLTKFEIKNSRTLSMNFASLQFNTVTSNEQVYGIGYKFKELVIPFKIRGEKKKLNNDLNTRLDVSVRKNRTLIRKLDQDIEEPTQGSRAISIRTSADYVINERLNLKLFYERTMNKPFTSSSFPTASTRAGISLRFTLAG